MNCNSIKDGLTLYLLENVDFQFSFYFFVRCSLSVAKMQIRSFCILWAFIDATLSTFLLTKPKVTFVFFSVSTSQTTASQ
jgi:hypothetical protein